MLVISSLPAVEDSLQLNQLIETKVNRPTLNMHLDSLEFPKHVKHMLESGTKNCLPTLFVFETLLVKILFHNLWSGALPSYKYVSGSFESTAHSAQGMLHFTVSSQMLSSITAYAELIQWQHLTSKTEYTGLKMNQKKSKLAHCLLTFQFPRPLRETADWMEAAWNCLYFCWCLQPSRPVQSL